MALNLSKVIARRAFLELTHGIVVNLGIGVPEGVATVAGEDGASEKTALTVESCPLGGVLTSGICFGGSTNGEALQETSYQFDFYDGAGIDNAFIGLAQLDRKGDINVSTFGPTIAEGGSPASYCRLRKRWPTPRRI